MSLSNFDDLLWIQAINVYLETEHWTSLAGRINTVY